MIRGREVLMGPAYNDRAPDFSGAPARGFALPAISLGQFRTYPTEKRTKGLSPESALCSYNIAHNHNDPP
jgi:hypothetical protein